jgi:predicted ABC-type ATPase
MEEPGERPVVVVIGGPNGAGKTTCAALLLPKALGMRQFVNADTIAAGLSAFEPESVAIQAGRIMLQRLDDLAAAHTSFAFETTLASRSFAPFLRRLRSEGYTVHVAYVWLRSPELAKSRVAERASRGGHSIPQDTIERRYWRGLTNFRQVYRSLADSWLLCDNSGSTLIHIATGVHEQPVWLFDREAYDEFEQFAAAARQRQEGAAG